MEVEVRDNFEQAIKTFNRKVALDGIMKLVKRRHDGFDPPSVRRRYKHFRHLLRLKKMERRFDDK